MCLQQNLISTGPLIHTDPISRTAKCHNNFTEASENGFCALASCVFSPVRETERERDRMIHVFYMKLTGHCFLLPKSK